jgi:hypothetical protein
MIRSFILAAALALPASAVIPAPRPVLVDELGPARRAQIEEAAARWEAIRWTNMRMVEQFPERVARGTRGAYRAKDIRALIVKVKALFSEVERVEIKVNELLYERLRRDPPSSDRDAREAAAASLFRVRMLTLFGNMYPRILDEMITEQGGMFAGRHYAGPDWRVELTMEECQAYNRWLYRIIGVTSAEMEAYTKRARAELGLPPNS